MANTGSNSSNKIWNVTNVSNYSISIGDIVGLQTINPKQTLDLLRYASQDAISTSVELPEALNSGLLILAKTEIDSETISGGGGGSAPIGQVLFGTGSGISSSDKFTYDGVNLKVDSGTDGVSGLTLPKLKLQSALTVSDFASAVAAYNLNIDGIGNLYVSGASNIITKITPAGVSSIISTGASVSINADICFDSQNSAYIIAGSVVKKYLQNGVLAYTVFNFPLGIYQIAVSQDSVIYAINSNGEVYKSNNGDEPVLFSTIASGNYYSLILTDDGVLRAIGEYSVSIIQPDGSSSLLLTFAGGQTGGKTVIDSLGNMYCTGAITSGIIIKITPQGIVTNFASVDGYSYGIAIDSSNSIYATEALQGNLYKITPDGTRTLLLNTGTYSLGVVCVSESIFYIAAYLSNNVREISSGTVPSALSVDSQGNLTTVNLDLSYTGYLANGILNTNLAGTSTIIPAVDSTKSGLMIPADKAKLDSYSTTNGNVNTYLSGTGSFTNLPSMTASTIIGSGAQGTNGTSVAIGNSSSADLTNGYLYGVSVGYTSNSEQQSVSIGAFSSSSFASVSIGTNSTSNASGLSIGVLSTGTNYGVSVGRESNGSNYGFAAGFRAGNGIANRIEIAPNNNFSAIRARISGQSTNKSIQMTCPQSDTAPTNAAFDFTNADGTLPQSMYQVQVNAAGTSAKIYFNIGGVIKSATLPLT